MRLSFRLIGKIGLLLVVFGFFMPVACDQNGFQIAGRMMDRDQIFYGLLMYLLIVTAIIGSLIGVLLLMRRGVSPSLDWGVTILCIASGLIVYFKFLDGLKLQTGAHLILVGWIVALVSHIIAKINREI